MRLMIRAWYMKLNSSSIFLYSIIEISVLSSSTTVEKSIQDLFTAGKRALYFFFLLGILLIQTKGRINSPNGHDIMSQSNTIHAQNARTRYSTCINKRSNKNRKEISRCKYRGAGECSKILHASRILFSTIKYNDLFFFSQMI